MKLSAFLTVTFLALTLVACGKPTAPESAISEGYGTTHEGKPAEGRNELEEQFESYFSTVIISVLTDYDDTLQDLFIAPTGVKNQT